MTQLDTPESNTARVVVGSGENPRRLRASMLLAALSGMMASSEVGFNAFNSLSREVNPYKMKRKSPEVQRIEESSNEEIRAWNAKVEAKRKIKKK